jgi:hypothetical protein
MYGSKEVGKVGQKEGRNQARKQARKQRSTGRVTAMPKRHRRRAKGGCLSWAFLFPTGFYFICTGYIPSIKSCCILRFPLAEKLNKLALRHGKFSSPKTFALPAEGLMCGLGGWEIDGVWLEKYSERFHPTLVTHSH